MDLSMEDLETAIYCTAWAMEDFKREEMRGLNQQYYPLCSKLYIKLLKQWSKKATEQVEHSIHGKVCQDRDRAQRLNQAMAAVNQSAVNANVSSTKATTQIHPHKDTVGMDQRTMMAG